MATRETQPSQILSDGPYEGLSLGAIAFLNTMPIYWPWRVPGAGASVRDFPVKLVEAVPAELNAMMLAGELLVSPVSSAFYLRNQKQLVLLDDLSVSSSGAVESVFFVADKSWGSALLEYDTIAVPNDSETSIALLAHLLEQITGQDCQARFKVFPVSQAKQALAEHGNTLIIGDNALLAKEAGFPAPFQINDLSSLWQAETGLPFVFAVWAAQRDWAEKHPEELQRINDLLRKNRDTFFRNQALFCDTLTMGSRQSQLPESVLYRYYMHCLTYGMSAEHHEALAHFGVLLQKMDAQAINALPSTDCLPSNASSVNS
jgi:chorismate dehydratase